MDQDGEVVDVYLQAKRDGSAEKRFFKRLVRSHGAEQSHEATRVRGSEEYAGSNLYGRHSDS